MTANQIFKMMLESDILKEKYNLTLEELEKTTLYEESEEDIIEVIKLIVNGIENGTPERTINSQVLTHFRL